MRRDLAQHPGVHGSRSDRLGADAALDALDRGFNNPRQVQLGSPHPPAFDTGTAKTSSLSADYVAETVTMNIDTGVVPSLRHEWSVLRSTTRSPERTRVSCVSVM